MGQSTIQVIMMKDLRLCIRRPYVHVCFVALTFGLGSGGLEHK